MTFVNIWIAAAAFIAIAFLFSGPIRTALSLLVTGIGSVVAGLFLAIFLIVIWSVVARASEGSLCEGRMTVDEAKPLPKSLEAFGTMLFGNDAVVVYRCLNGGVLVCPIGNGFTCDRPSANRNNPDVARFCKRNPNEPIVPTTVSGHNTIYQWKCVRGKPVIDYTDKLDERGFRVDGWTVAAGVH